MTTSEVEPDGLLLVDKPAGPTSHDVVRLVRRALRTRAVGHAGTLDPFATGLLACGIGRATRLLRFFSESEKTYEGVIRLGFATDTADSTGAPLHDEREAPSFDRVLEAVSEHLTGALQQVPPMYSAKKLDGVAMHVRARRGEAVEQKPVAVLTSGWELAPLDATRVSFRVTCTAGTYVRVLGSDLGELLGCGAHLESLRRTRSGALRVEDAVPADALDPETASAALLPLEAIPLPMPKLCALDAEAVAAFAHGRATDIDAWTAEGASAGVVSCWSPDARLIGVAEARKGAVHPRVVLVS